MSYRILIVDIETDLLSSLQELLEISGYKVTTLNDLRRIFTICDKGTFDIVLSHWVDPYVNVDEVFDQLKISYPNMKFVVMTGSIDVEDKFLKKHHFIYKPFQLGDLEKLLKSI